MILETDVLRGSPAPLGATWDGSGTNFALFSEHASRVELCLFRDARDRREWRRIPMVDHRGPIFHCYVPGVGPGTPYGYRVDGPYRPDKGHRFNPAKLLIDPYAKAIHGSINWDAPVFGFRQGRDGSDLSPDLRDDAWGKPRSVVVNPAFDWEGDQRLQTPWTDTVIYEVHLKGFSKLNPELPPDLRGTYAGFAHPASIEYLQTLGVTAVEFLPIHALVDDEFLVRHGKRNYWGYNTLGFFAPEGRYSASGDMGGQVNEFKEMVKSLHRAGIELILDVVYNHTAEGGSLGPTLSFRGIDNEVYYRLFAADQRFYEDVTGTGNTVDVSHPQVLELILDSLRYWVEEMHVDGFRFDLAPALGREQASFSPDSAFFRAIHDDPVVSSVKLIAEPWDIGPGGYQLGHFPNGWSEWNDRYRDSVRRFWRGDRATSDELRSRLTGSPDLYQASRRLPSASVNFVTAHDGFTMRDLVSYERKHNLDNGELNRDGSDQNYSWNNGVEGPTTDPAIESPRLQQMRNMFATLLLSQGVPMILAGDEYGRSQIGNNNAYCQDNEVSWLRWDRTDEERELSAFVRSVIALRRRSAALRQLDFYMPNRKPEESGPEVTWFRPDGKPLTASEHFDPNRRTIGFRLVPSDDLGNERSAKNEALFVSINGGNGAVRWRLPDSVDGQCRSWVPELSTAQGDPISASSRRPGERVLVPGHSVTVWRLSEGDPS
jgi:isoamylase